MKNSEQDGGFAWLLLVAVILGCLTEGWLTRSLVRELAPDPSSAELPTYTLTGRVDGRQTLDYGEYDE